MHHLCLSSPSERPSNQPWCSSKGLACLGRSEPDISSLTLLASYALKLQKSGNRFGGVFSIRLPHLPVELPCTKCRPWMPSQDRRRQRLQASTISSMMISRRQLMATHLPISATPGSILPLKLRVNVSSISICLSASAQSLTVPQIPLPHPSVPTD